MEPRHSAAADRRRPVHPFGPAQNQTDLLKLQPGWPLPNELRLGAGDDLLGPPDPPTGLYLSQLRVRPGLELRWQPLCHGSKGNAAARNVCLRATALSRVERQSRRTPWPRRLFAGWEIPGNL